MKKWYVYELRDQRTNQPFYIGMTGNIASTMARHWAGAPTPARERCRELADLGHQLDLRVLAEFDDRTEALAEEARRIKAGKDLVNILPRVAAEKEPRGRFVVTLSEQERFDLDQHRVKLGLRSWSDVIRYWIALEPQTSRRIERRVSATT
jgi:predicted GIY-YIG superfamily endonuclease